MRVEELKSGVRKNGICLPYLNYGAPRVRVGGVECRMLALVVVVVLW